MPKTRKDASQSTHKAGTRPFSADIGADGLSTASDFKRFATAIALDVITGRLGAREAGAAGAQLKSVIKITELEHKYGYAKPSPGKASHLLVGE